MRPEENPYRSPETVEPPAPRPTALGRGWRYLAAALAMPLGAILIYVAVSLVSQVLVATLLGLSGPLALFRLYGDRWISINFPLSLFLGAAAAFAIVLRILSETVVAGWIAIGAGGLTLAAMVCARLFWDRHYSVALAIYVPLALFSVALTTMGYRWVLRQAR